MDAFIPFLFVFEAGLVLPEGEKPEPQRLPALFEKIRRRAYSDIAADSGGPTLCGITLNTYRNYCSRKGYPKPSTEGLRNMPYAHWRECLALLFWNTVQADKIKSAPLRHIIADWVWASGPSVIKRVQKILGINADGIFGPDTLKAVNNAPARRLFDDIRQARFDFIERISKGKNSVFKKGWLNRLNAITFDGLIYKNPPVTWNFQ